MSDVVGLDAKIKEVEDRFTKLGDEIKTRSEKVAELNREIGAIQQEQFRLQGRFAALTELKGGGNPPAETIN